MELYSIAEMKEVALSYSKSIWFPVLVAFFCALDTFLPVFPNDFLIAAAVVACPERWLYCTFAQTFGITIGCSIFATYA